MRSDPLLHDSLGTDAQSALLAVARPRRRRQRLFGLILTAAVIGAAILIVPSATAAPSPSLKDIEKKVELLQSQAEAATEDYDQTKVQLKSIDVRLGASQVQLAAQRKEVQLARTELGRLASETYQKGQLSTLDLVLGNDPDSALAQAGYLPSLADRQVGAMNRLKLGEQHLAATESQIQTQQHNALAAQAKLKQTRDTVNKKLADATGVVAHLKSSQRATLSTDVSNSMGGNVPGNADTAFCDGKAAAAPTAAARTALTFACAQLGKPYQWAADGPGSYDCSGLTMKAYAAAGISLPHSSRLQVGYGTRVSVGSLEPGDLLFFHSPISHVTIYLGDGLMVHAPQTGEDVKVASVYETPVAAVRF